MATMDIIDSAPNITINLNDGAAAKFLTEKPLKIEYRHAPAPRVPDVIPPINIDIHGTLGCVSEFLEKRIDTIDTEHAMIIVDREKVMITLVMNETDPFMRGTVEGHLEFDPRFEAFGINNSDMLWQPLPLAMFMKMQRSFFKSREENMSYVSTLMNYKATIEQKVERYNNEKGDKTDNFQQVVNYNLPKSFHLSIPIFKGYPKEDIEVETFASVDGRSITFVLLSPGANDAVEALRDMAIDAELDKIRTIMEGFIKRASEDGDIVLNIPILEV